MYIIDSGPNIWKCFVFWSLQNDMYKKITSFSAHNFMCFFYLKNIIFCQLFFQSSPFFVGPSECHRKSKVTRFRLNSIQTLYLSVCLSRFVNGASGFVAFSKANEQAAADSWSSRANWARSQSPYVSCTACVHAKDSFSLSFLSRFDSVCDARDICGMLLFLCDTQRLPINHSLTTG